MISVWSARNLWFQFEAPVTYDFSLKRTTYEAAWLQQLQNLNLDYPTSIQGLIAWPVFKAWLPG